MKKSDLVNLVKEEIKKIISEVDALNADTEESNDIESSEKETLEPKIDDKEEVVENDINSDLRFISDSANSILESLKNSDDELETWITSHIYAAKELIGHVDDYLSQSNDDENGEIKDQEEVGGVGINSEKEVEEPTEMEKQSIKEDVGENEKAGIEKEINILKNKQNKTLDVDGRIKDLENKLKSKDISESDTYNKKQNFDGSRPNRKFKVSRQEADKFREYIKDLASEEKYDEISKSIKALEDHANKRNPKFDLKFKGSNDK